MENFGSILFQYEINVNKTICLIESTDEKLINAKSAMLFNVTCSKYICVQMYIGPACHKQGYAGPPPPLRSGHIFLKDAECVD